MWLAEHLTRDKIFLLIGATGFFHELFITSVERPFILTASLALMGFPLVLRGEDKLREKGVLPKDGA